MAVYLITGASSGIGLEMTRLAVARGHKVYALARRIDLLREEAARLGELMQPVECDVTDRARVHEVCASLPELPDVALLNAGLGAFGDKDTFNRDSYERVFAVNYFGALNFIGEFYEPFVKRGRGVFVGVSSLAGERALPGWPAYCASKAALTTTLEGMAISYRRTGIRYVTVRPSFIDTPMTAGQQQGMFLIWDAKRAARYILDGIEAGKIDIAFPLLTRLLVWFARTLPIRIYRAVMR